MSGKKNMLAYSRPYCYNNDISTLCSGGFVLLQRGGMEVAMKRFKELVVLLLLLCAVAGCKNTNDTNGDIENTGTPLPTQGETPTPTVPAAPTGADVPTIAADASATPNVTEPLVTPSMTESPATPAVTETPATPTAVPTISVTAARAQLTEQIDETVYEILDTGTTYFIDDEIYYVFRIYQDEERLYPDIAVHTGSGALYYYDTSGTLSVFEKFPLDNVETPDIGDGSITHHEAIARLEELTQEQLNLPAQIDEYTLLVDEWNTVVNGKECYCINAFAPLENRMQLMGLFYVALDGSAMYRVEDDVFVEMK